MTTLQNATGANETLEFTLQQDRRPGLSNRKIAVLMRVGDRIDMLVLSDVQGHTRFIPNVGDRIVDELSALIGSGVLAETSSIIVIHHSDGATLASSDGNRIRDLPSDSIQAGSFHGSDLEQSIRNDIALLRASQQTLEDTEISGLIYDGRSCTLSLVTSTVN
ncbi:MAG TPA: hypothetical protein VEH81_14955 [Ktedonobacteraceae bacterium]|nr:hypothetical protein [Ktedonobacteraceae bacterium]